MARQSITAALIVLHLLTIVHLTGVSAEEEWLIRHQPVISAQPDQPIEIEAELEGRTTGVLMYIMARKAGQKDFRSFPMTMEDEALFRGQIPAKWSTTEGLEYYLRLQDPVGRLLARYPEDETFINIVISAAQPEEMTPPAGESQPEPEPKQVESEPIAPPVVPPTAPQEAVQAPAQEAPAQKEQTVEAVEAPAQEEETEQAAAPAEEAKPEQEVAQTPPRKPAAEEEPTAPQEKPKIVMEEKKGGLQTWHWLGLGALAVVGIAAVAMSGGDGDGKGGGTPAGKLPDPPDHP